MTLLALVAVPALAEQQAVSPGQRRGRGGPDDALSVQEIERQFDRFEIAEARRALGLDEQAFAVVGQRLQRIQNVKRRHQNQRRSLLVGLRAAIESGEPETDQASVLAMLAELSSLGVRQAQELRRAHEGLDAVLTVRQRAQVRLFQERFERQKLDLLARARQQGRGGGNRRPNPAR